MIHSTSVMIVIGKIKQDQQTFEGVKTRLMSSIYCHYNNHMNKNNLAFEYFNLLMLF